MPPASKHWKNGESGKWNEQVNVILRKPVVFHHPKHHKKTIGPQEYHGYRKLFNITSLKRYSCQGHHVPGTHAGEHKAGVGTHMPV
ncbi:hypothetical protein F2Q68_00042792 [Brassica cretica]|uniref:Uncharacterized protein n=1 Tax=Brassica cretica TaxID=69181 RepID=A0A8S9MFX3_BRACR|nr:hypothetical protein F2Q68_00042792 [Brassica cretica]